MQNAAANCNLAEASRYSNQLETVLRWSCSTSEEWIMHTYMTFSRSVGVSVLKPEIQFQATLLCLQSNAVTATLEEKPMSLHKSPVCSGGPSEAWLSSGTWKHRVWGPFPVVWPQPSPLNLPVRERPNGCILSYLSLLPSQWESKKLFSPFFFIYT